MTSPSTSMLDAMRTSALYQVETHACPEPGCTRQFVRKFSLIEHVKTHSSEGGAHVCPVRSCGKSFSTSGNLSRHKRLHGYIEPLSCPVDGCVCVFPSNRKLEKHMKFHYSTDVKPCAVPGCGKAFSTTGNLNRHLKNHHSAADRAAANVTCHSPLAVKTETNQGGESPTGAEQWMPPTSDSDDDDFLWSNLCFEPTDLELISEPVDELWSPEMLDTLSCLLDDGSDESALVTPLE